MYPFISTNHAWAVEKIRRIRTSSTFLNANTTISYHLLQCRQPYFELAPRVSPSRVSQEPTPGGRWDSRSLTLPPHRISSSPQAFANQRSAFKTVTTALVRGAERRTGSGASTVPFFRPPFASQFPLFVGPSLPPRHPSSPHRFFASPPAYSCSCFVRLLGRRADARPDIHALRFCSRRQVRVCFFTSDLADGFLGDGSGGDAKALSNPPAI